MKKNQNLSATDAQSITSLEIALVTGKTHAHVLRDIRNMEPAWEQEHGAKFGLMQQREDLPNGGYRLRPVFVLSKIESLYIATKFNDLARAKLVLRWEELEQVSLHVLRNYWLLNARFCSRATRFADSRLNRRTLLLTVA